MKKFLSKKMILLPPFEPFSVLFMESGTFEKPKHCKKLTVKVIAAGGHGGAGGGMTMWGGVGGVGGVVVKIYEGEELRNLPDLIDIVVGVCPNATERQDKTHHLMKK